MDPNEHAPETVLNWCRNLVATLNDGGVWGIPRSGVVFKIDKKNQCLILTAGTDDDPDFLVSRVVFDQIGWKVVTQKEHKMLVDSSK